MSIRKADMNDMATVKDITITTISNIYPHYYPEGAVKFFINHHKDEKIIADIEAGRVYLCLSDDGEPVGTVTLSGNEIDRLFVLPGSQKKGYGRQLLDFAEERISEEYDEITLSASFSGKKIYLKRGFVETDWNIVDCGNGDYLCFDTMVKKEEKK